eukprot:753424-Hanusia_phi.AAC.2
MSAKSDVCTSDCSAIFVVLSSADILLPSYVGLKVSALIKDSDPRNRVCAVQALKQASIPLPV